HQAERRILFPALSPRTVQDRWLPLFRDAAGRLLDDLAPRGRADLVTDYAMPLAGAALVAITGLARMTPARMDAVSQAMIDGCANYAGDDAVEARCHAATAEIDAEIDAALADAPGASVLGVQRDAGLAMASIRANVKLVISGGQNEPRDAIAGTIAALLMHPEALDHIRARRCDWGAAFDEYARWQAPIGMSPRQVAAPDTIGGLRFETGERVFLMFGSAGRDEAVFDRPERFDILRDTGPAIPFGAGPHFCAGAAAARALIVTVALPMAFARLPGLRLTGDVRWQGWAFRGPVAVPTAWDA
ncbi:MAG: cytochrome P450, partial [Gemmobacter sp.]